MDPNGLFYYTSEGQKSITTVKKTTVVILRNNDGLGNEFDSDRLIYKNDGFTTKLVYVDKVGANCNPNEDFIKANNGLTVADGKYFLTGKNLSKQPDGTYNLAHYLNVISLNTDDTSIPEDMRNEINKGDILFHANQKKDFDIYANNMKPYSAACVIGMDGQTHQNEMMTSLMDGVINPENITVYIRSMSNIGKGK